MSAWKGSIDGPKRTYAFIQSLYSDNHYTSKEYGAQLAEISDKALKQRLKDGNWNYDEDAGTLMKYNNIRDCFTNNIVKDGQKYLIVDVARYGRDKTVFNYFDGLESCKRESLSEQGTDKTIQLIRDRAAEEKIPYSHILIDEDGVGGGVVDQLRRQRLHGWLNTDPDQDSSPPSDAAHCQPNVGR